MSYATISKGKLGSVTLPGSQHGHSESMSVETKKQHPLSRSHHRMFPLAVVALLTAVFRFKLRARAKDVPPPIAGALGQVQSVLQSLSWRSSSSGNRWKRR